MIKALIRLFIGLVILIIKIKKVISEWRNSLTTYNSQEVEKNIEEIIKKCRNFFKKVV